MEHELLWKRFLKGEKEALSLIFRSLFDELYDYGLKLSRSADIVDDSVQDMFFKLWKNRENLNEIKVLKPYLLKALRHHIIDNLNWKNRFISYDNPPKELFDIEFSHEDFLIDKQLTQETREKVIRIINDLPKRQKEAIYLRFFRDYDFKTISEIMEMNVQSVRNTIYRALLTLREIKKEVSE